MDILLTSSNRDLFAPELEEDRKVKEADAVTSDLLEALLSVSFFFTRLGPGN